ncbi:MAG: hypothetical protein HOI08_02455 [Flavobacteriaceae bacterium]|nr:hypothetical protein [Flavobacteriaceae bacterium]
MRKFVLIFIIIPSILIAQNDVNEVVVIKSDKQIEKFASSLGQNELKIDFLDLLIFPALTVGYEKTNNSSSGIGATLFLNLKKNGDGVIDWNDKFVITPYYRFYFSKSEDFGSKGFFAEVFSKFAFGKSSGKDTFWEGGFGEEYPINNYFDIAPGLAVGNKWINRKGFTFEILFGLGRNLLYDEEDNNGHNGGRGTIVTRGGFSIGKRF